MNEEYGNSTRDPVLHQLQAALDVLDRQAADGAMHAHTIDSRMAEHVHALESTLYGLVDVLVEKRAINESELSAAANRVSDTIEQRGERAHGGVMMRVDPPGDDSFTAVNCAERMPICKAICCRLSFPLSAEEIQDGKLKWDLGRPYFIRHNEQGACVHQDIVNGACGVYNHRPGICKRYSCASDPRIWKDFAGMILNQEWLDEYLGPERPQLIQIRMDKVDGAK